MAENEKTAAPKESTNQNRTTTNTQSPASTANISSSQPAWVNRWTIFGLGALTAVALVAAVTGWTRAGTLKQEVAALQTRVTELEGNIGAANTQLAAVSAERDALKPMIDDLNRQTAAFDQERSLMLNERNGIVQRLGTASTARDDAENEIVRLEKRVATLTSQRDELMPLVAQVASLTETRSSLLGERNALVQKVGGVAWARDIADGKVSDLTKDLKTREAQIAALVRQQDQLHNEIAVIESNVGTKQALTEQVERLRIEAREVEGQLSNLTARRDEATAEVTKAEQRVAELEQAAVLSSQNLAAIGNEVAQRSAALADLRRQQQEATRQSDSIKAAFLDAEKQLSLLRNQMANQAEVLRAAAQPGGIELNSNNAPVENNSGESTSPQPAQ